ncbi:hypothetical protein ACJZ2D_005986 [Fusarium nematophilum]
MPLHILEGGYDTLSCENLEALTASRVAIIEPAYDEYLVSDKLLDDPPPPSALELLPSSDISMEFTRSVATKAATDLCVSKISEPDADNFMGFCLEENCMVFKGERGMFDRFLDFSDAITQNRDVRVAFNVRPQLRIPRGGLEYGLKYEEFAARVEILDCAVWIKAPLRRGSSAESSSQLDVLMQSSVPSTPDRGFASNESLSASERMSSSEDFIESDNLARSEILSNASSSPLSPPPEGFIESYDLAKSKSPSNASSSSLSPPPEKIVTPPSLKKRLSTPWEVDWDTDDGSPKKDAKRYVKSHAGLRRSDRFQKL